MAFLIKSLCYTICASIGYLMGCSNLAHFLSKRRGFDIRTVGSQNPGASNTVITMGWTAGAMVCIHDVGKAFLAALLTSLLFPQLALAAAVGGVAAVLGHIFPATMRFRGGKGFAAYIGMTLALDWKFALAIVGAIVLITLITDYIVLGTITTVVSFPVYSAFCGHQYWIAALAAVASLVILFRHRENMVRIAKGTEVGLRGARKTPDSHF